MRRDLQTLAGREFDLLVVGAGIYGATVACDAAQRGLTVALIDRDDFGAGTSANSLKTVHGGLRSLQRAHLPEMRRFIRERRTLLRIAPHLVRPLRFVIATRGALSRSRAAMRIALTVNDWVARDRNEGVDPARHLPPSHLLGRAAVASLSPDLAQASATGGASWYDAQLYNPDRLLLGFVAAASTHGAAVANYVGATGFLRRDGVVRGAAVRDGLTGASFDIRARMTVYAGGGWVASLLDGLDRSLNQRIGIRMSRAFNLVTRLPAPPCAIGSAAGGQYLFCVPWRGIAMFGTMHDMHADRPESLSISRGDVERFIALINQAFPSIRMTVDDVTLVHRGLLPAVGGSNDHVRLAKESPIRDHADDGVQGLMTVVGVRYTTARDTAQRVVDRVVARLAVPAGPSRSAQEPLPGADLGDVAAFERDVRRSSVGIRPSVVERLIPSYGSRCGSLIAGMQADPGLAVPLAPDCDITRAEVVHAVREEMAVRLSDVALRRTEAGSAGSPGRTALHGMADVMASELGWDADRVEAEVRLVEARYGIPA